MTARKTATTATAEGHVLAGTDEGQQDATPAVFDFEAWLGKGTRPRRWVTLYGDNGLQAEIAQLQDERDALVVGDPGDVEYSWGGSPADDAAPSAALDEQIHALQERLAASAFKVLVQSLDSEEQDEIERAYPDPEDGNDAGKERASLNRLMARLAKQIIRPRTFTVDDMVRMRKAIGEPEVGKWLEADSALNSGASVTTPTWLGSFGERRVS